MAKKLLFFLLCLSNITISFNTGAVAAAIPLISDDLGKPDWLVAKVVSYYMVPYGLGALLYAPLTRIVSYRLILCVAMAVYGFASFLSGSSVVLDQMLVAQVMAGIAAASSTPLSLMIIGEFFDRDVRGRLVGTYFGFSFFASTVGMAFMGAVHWRWLFFIPSVVGFVTALSFYFLGKGILDGKHEANINYITAFAKSNIRNVFLLIFALSFLYQGMQRWYGVYLNHEYGLSKVTISYILIITAMAGLLGQQVGGYLSDKKGRVFTGFLGVTSLGIATMFLVGHYSTPVLVGVLSFIGISWTVGHNAISTVLTDFPDEDRPVMASLNSAVRFFSGGIGFSIVGIFFAQSFSLTFLVVGVLMLITSFFFKKVVH